MSDESDDSRIASDSDDSADSDVSSHLETEVSEMSLDGVSNKSLGAVYSDDLPPLEELLVEDKAAKVKKPKAKKKKAKTKKIASNSADSLAKDNNDSDKEMPGLIDTSGSDSSREAREKRITKSKLPKAAR